MANLTVRNNHFPPSHLMERDPFRAMERDPFRMMREMLNWDPFATGPSDRTTGAYVPAFDIRETKTSYVFKADMPGLKESDVDVTYQGNQLVVRGKREMEEEDADDTIHAYERPYGSFTRVFTLPSGVDADHATAELKNGLLTIAIPKSAGSQPKKIALATPKAKG